MVEENQDHYCPPAREMNPITLTNKSWWDTTHVGSQIPLTEDWYPEFQDRYEIPSQQEAPISQAYQQESQSPVKSEDDEEESKWDAKMNDYDEESREYYQEYRANHRDPQMK